MHKKRTIDHVGISSTVRTLVRSGSDSRLSSHVKESAITKALNILSPFVDNGIFKYKGDFNVVNDVDDIRSIAFVGLHKALLKDVGHGSLPMLSCMVGAQAANYFHRSNKKRRLLGNTPVDNTFAGSDRVYVSMNMNDEHDVDYESNIENDIDRSKVNQMIQSASMTLPKWERWAVTAIYIDGDSYLKTSRAYVSLNNKTKKTSDFNNCLSGALQMLKERIVNDHGVDNVLSMLETLGSI